MSYKQESAHKAFHALHSRSGFKLGMERVSTTTRTHKVAGGVYKKNELGMITWHPNDHDSRLVVLNDADGSEWRKIKQER